MQLLEAFNIELLQTTQAFTATDTSRGRKTAMAQIESEDQDADEHAAEAVNVRWGSLHAL